MTKALFLLPVRSQPRYKKRIAGVVSEGLPCQALYFDRDYFAGTEFPCPASSMGEIAHGRYLSRLKTLAGAIPVVREHVDSQTVVYCFGMDMLLLAKLATLGCNNILYEVADIRPILVENSLAAKFMRFVEKQLLRNIKCLIVTAPGYVTGYYEQMLKVRNLRHLVIENKIDAAVFQDQTEQRLVPQAGAKLRLGYFGLLRCETSWQALRKLALASPATIEIIIYGKAVAPANIKEQCATIENIRYCGEYVAPDDLPAMYQSVDVVWACYPYGLQSPGNWMWAMTNRFYESCFFAKPMITLAGSADARRVQQYDIGFSVTLSNIEETLAFLQDQLTPANVQRLAANVRAVPKEVYVYHDEHKQLAREMMSLS